MGALPRVDFRFRRGFVLLVSILLITLLAVFGAALFGLAGTSLRTTNHRLTGKEALNLALGGMVYGVARLTENSSYSGFSNRPLGTGTVTLTVSTPPGQPTARILEATGTVTGSRYTMQRRVRAYMDGGALPPVYYYALVAKTRFTLNGNVQVTSLPALNAGHAHSNMDLTVNGGGTGMVNGKATATGTVTLSGSPIVTGGTQSGAAAVQFPEVDDSFKEQSLVNGITTGDVTVSDGSTVQGKIIGDLTIKAPLGGRVNGVVWVTGKVKVDGPVAGTGTICAEKKMELETRLYDPFTDPASVAYITTASGASAITVSGNRSFKGILYAPNGTVEITGNAIFYGIILANAITISGTPTITRWTDFDRNAPPLPRFLALKGFQEL